QFLALYDGVIVVRIRSRSDRHDRDYAKKHRTNNPCGHEATPGKWIGKRSREVRSLVLRYSPTPPLARRPGRTNPFGLGIWPGHDELRRGNDRGRGRDQVLGHEPARLGLRAADRRALPPLD